MRVHSVGHGRRQVQVTHLLPHIPRDARDGRLHFGHHTLRFRAPLQARRAALGLLGHSADRGDVLLELTGDELAIAPQAALQGHTVGGVANGAHALGDLLTLPGEPLVLVARGCHVLRHLLQARCRLWQAARTALVPLVVRVLEGLGHPVERLFYLRPSLGGSPLFGGHGRRDGLAQFLLYMEEVW